MYAALAACILLAAGSSAVPGPIAKPVVLKANSPLLHKHGRWDASDGSWWAGTGVKIVASNLSSFKLNLGPRTTEPSTAISYSVDYGNYTTMNVTAGVNVIPIPPTTSKKDRVFRLQAEHYFDNRLHLENIELNPGAVLKPYRPSKLRFQFIGDSLSVGYFNPNGVNDAWTFLISQYFKAEHNIQAQPGACLTDRACYENPRGMSYLFFRTEGSNYYTSTDHNYTTPWDFKKDLTPTHVFLVIGANDDSNRVPSETFGQELPSFLASIRKLYPTQDIFLLSPWGWPVWPETVPFRTYYDAIWPAAVANRTAAGDRRLHLINGTNWLGYDGVLGRNNGHPSPKGQLQVADHMVTWLKNWGLKPGHWES